MHDFIYMKNKNRHNSFTETEVRIMVTSGIQLDIDWERLWVNVLDATYGLYLGMTVSSMVYTYAKSLSYTLKIYALYYIC